MTIALNATCLLLGRLNSNTTAFPQSITFAFAKFFAIGYIHPQPIVECFGDMRMATNFQNNFVLNFKHLEIILTYILNYFKFSNTKVILCTTFIINNNLIKAFHN